MGTSEDLSGRTALVTGGGRGIGRAASRGLAAAGMRVVVVYRQDVQAAEETVVAIAKAGGTATFLQCDVSDSTQVARLADTVLQESGAIDVLVNNAGITRPQPLDEISERDWDELIDVNLKSVFLMTQAFVPAMQTRRWGRVINLSSVAAQLGGIVGPHYAASKAGVVGMTHSYAALLAPEGITVNAIAPALIETAMTARNALATASRIPVGRLGHIDEVGDVVVMLARNGYITGQTISVNGGWYMTS